MEITYADISKAKAILGYKPKTSVDEGIKKFIEWYFEIKEKLKEKKVLKDKHT